MRWTVYLEGGPRRVNHAAVAINDKVYSFGGYCSGEQQPDFVDIHELDTQTYRWKEVVHRNRGTVYGYSDDEMDVDGPRVPPTMAIPYQRYGHTVCAYKGKAYLWGGRNDGFGASNMLHEFDPETRMWRVVAKQSNAPPSRDGHTAVVVDHRMIVFGGFEEDLQRFSQETYAFDFNTEKWSEIATKGSPPLWRDFHTAVAIDDVMYVFGGRSDQQGQFHSTRDIYDDSLMALDLRTGQWNTELVTGPKPSGRRSHSAWAYEGNMYVFGGYLGTQNIHYSDLYRFDPKQKTWKLLRLGGISPSARRRQCTVLLGDRVFLFGGTMPNPRACVQTTPHQATTSSGLADLADLYVLDYRPSLKQLAMSGVMDALGRDYGYVAHIKHILPVEIRRELMYMSVPNAVQQRVETSG